MIEKVERLLYRLLQKYSKMMEKVSESIKSYQHLINNS